MSEEQGDGNMQQFISNRGWNFIGNCGCRNAMNKFSNPDERLQKYEIWLNNELTRFEVRLLYGHNSRMVALANVSNYKIVYERHLPN